MSFLGFHRGFYRGIGARQIIQGGLSFKAFSNINLPRQDNVTLDSDTYRTNETGDALGFFYEGGPGLPDGVTLAPDGTLSADSAAILGVTSGHQYRMYTSDWTDRSTMPGVVLARRLDTLSEINTYKFPDGKVGNLDFDTSVKPPGGGGTARINVLSSDGENSGAFMVRYNGLAWESNPSSDTEFGNGTTHYVSFLVHAPSTQAYQDWPLDIGQGSVLPDHKLAIISASRFSFNPHEVVWQNNYMAGILTGYHNSNFQLFQETIGSPPTACTTSQTERFYQNQIDRGAARLSGTNPDNGDAWTSCDQLRARYGFLISQRSGSSDRRTDVKRGYGDPLSIGFRQHPNELLWLCTRIQVGTFGTASSRVMQWAARPGRQPVLLHDANNINITDAGEGYKAVWFTPYTTNRLPGGARITGRTGEITGATLHTCGLSTPSGDGVLEYNSTTKRFRWHGAGQSFGLERGFSEANQKLWLNVMSSGEGESWVLLDVKPDYLPQSGAATETVSIATDGRNDTQINYAELIVQTDTPIAPGGHSLPGVP